MSSIFRSIYFGIFLSVITFPSYAQWTQTNGPSGANILSMAVSGADIYVGTGGGGIFYSSNSGSNFSYVNNDMYSTTITAIDIESFGVLAGTGGSGIFITTNNGAHWATINNGLSNLNVNAIVSIGTNLFAGTGGGGVFRSTNNGTSWIAVNSGLTNLTVNKLYVSGTKLYAGTSSGGFVTENNGTSWTNITSTLSNKNIKSFLVNGTRLFVGNNSGVFYSDNNGTSWTTPTTNTGSATNSFEMMGTILFAATSTGGCFRSTNNGADWVASNTYSGLFNKSGTLLVKNGSTIFYASNGGGLYKSTDNGSNWIENNNGITSSTVRAVYETNGKLYAGVQGGGIHTSTDGGTTWIPQNNGITDYALNFLAFTSSGTTVFAGAQSLLTPPTTAGIFYSTNGGAVWTQCFSGKSVSALATSTNGSITKIFAGTSDGLYYSSNNGTQWTNVSSVPSGVMQAIKFEGALGVAAKFNVGRPYITTDYGATWTQATGTTPNTNILSIAIDGTTIIVGTNNGVYKSTDYGTTWVSFNSGLPSFLSVNSVAVATINTGSSNVRFSINAFEKNHSLNNQSDTPIKLLFIGTQADGTYSSMGGDWQQINDGLGNGTTDYNLFQTGPKIYICTFGFGISSRDISNTYDKYFKTYTVAVRANPVDGGKVSTVGTGPYIGGSDVTVNAEANPGYIFMDWTENGNPVSTLASYTFKISSNRNLVANFSRQRYTISANCNPPEGGTVSGTGTYNGAEKVTLVATENAGYKFVKWTENGADVSTNSTLMFDATANRNLIAVFQVKKWKLSISVKPEAGGKVKLNGEYITKNEYEFNHDETIELEAIPNEGFLLLYFAESEIFTLSRVNTCTIKIARDMNVEVFFTQKEYKIVITINPTEGGKVKLDGVYIVPDATYFRTYNQSFSLHAEANYDYSFKNFTEGGTELSKTDYSDIIKADRNIVANYSKRLSKLTLTVDPPNGGTLLINGVPITKNEYEYEEGTEIVLQAKPNQGFKFYDYTIYEEKSTSSELKISMIGHVDVVVRFVPEHLHLNLSVNPPNSGTLTLNGEPVTNYEIEHPYGYAVDLAANGNKGYVFLNFTNNGSELERVPGEQRTMFYLFNDRNIAANFKLLPPNKIYGQFPTDGATNVPDDVTISWKNDPDRIVSKTKVFLAKNEINVNGDATFEIDEMIDNYKPSVKLDLNTIYKWTVMQVNGSATVINDISTFKTNSVTELDEKIKSALPTEYRLHQNFPNPFNPSTTIRFEVPKLSNIKISIYDVLGIKVLKVADRTYSAGTHIINVNLENLTSGIYFCTMESGTFKETKKLLLMK